MKQNTKSNTSESVLLNPQTPKPLGLRSRLSTLLFLIQMTSLLGLQASESWIEDFTANPLQQGWSVEGDASLFSWSMEDENLMATWDSSQPNTFFYRKLETPVHHTDTFSLGFTIHVDSITGGVNPEKSGSLQLALGLIQTTRAFTPGFIRGTGTDSPELFEFNYFPDTGFGATISPVMISSEHQFAAGFEFPVTMKSGSTYEITMSLNGRTGILTTTILEDQTHEIPVQDVVITEDFSGFTLDAVSITSYSDAGQSEFAGSILATARIDDIQFQSLDSNLLTLQTKLEQGVPSINFTAEIGMVYQLQRSTDLIDWIDLEVRHVAEFSGETALEDPNPPSGHAFYRIQKSQVIAQ